MTRKGSMAAVVGAALAALGWVAIAQAQGANGAPRDREVGPGFGPGRLAEELGLNDEQRTQLEALHSKQRETMKPLMDTARQAHDAFRQALEAEAADPATVGQAAIAMHAAEKKLRAAHQAAFEEMKSILTPEQRAKLEQLRERGPRHGGKEPRP